MQFFKKYLTTLGITVHCYKRWTFGSNILLHVQALKKCNTRTALARLVSPGYHSLKSWYCPPDTYRNDRNLLSLRDVLSAHTFWSWISKKQSTAQEKVHCKIFDEVWKCRSFTYLVTFFLPFRWTCLSISMSSNAWINDMLKLKNQRSSNIYTTIFHRLASQEVSFEWGWGKIKKFIFLNLQFWLGTKTRASDATTKFLILIGLLQIEENSGKKLPILIGFSHSLWD